MKQTVHILATVRRPELLSAALLVFNTVRIGFPEATIYVWGNALDVESERAIASAAMLVQANFSNVPATSHDAWIETCINKSSDPFWICDTDVVFLNRMSDPNARTIFAGRHEPEFDEEFTGTVHVERLHTAVMYINPAAFRMALREWMAAIPAPWRDTAHFPLIRQNFVPVLKGRTSFYDTLAGAYHAFGGTRFTPEQNAAFEHLHCATYVDEVVAGAPSLKDLKLCHEQIYRDPIFARGLRVQQEKYYASRTVKRKTRK